MNNEFDVQETQVKKKKKFSFNLIVNYVVKFLPIITTVFLALGVLGFVFNGVSGIIDSISALINGFKGNGFTGVFSNFFNGLEVGFASLIKYLFYAVVSAGFSKLLNRR